MAEQRNANPKGAHVTVLGAGSLGSVYAAWAAQAGNTVTVVARSAHVDAINSGGLTLINRDGSTQNISLRATTDPRDIEECDFLCLACKAPDTEPLLDAFLSRQRTLKASFSIQNGVRQAEPLQRRFGSRALACVSMVGGTLASPGKVVHTFDGATYLGPTSDQDSQQALSAAADLAAHFGGNGFVGRQDIMSVLWSKAILAAAAMAMSAITRMNYHRIFELEGNREAFLDLVKEAALIANAEAIPLIDLPGPLQAGYLVGLPQDKALALLADLSKSLVSSGQTKVRVSMLQSIERRRPTEVTAVFTDLLTIAARHNLHLPRLQFVTKVLESIDQDIRET